MIVAIESHQGALDMQISTIGLDIAKNVFQVHGIDAAEKVFGSNLGAARCWHSSKRCHPALSALRPAPRPIIGRENSRSLGTRFVCAGKRRAGLR